MRTRREIKWCPIYSILSLVLVFSVLGELQSVPTLLQAWTLSLRFTECSFGQLLTDTKQNI